MPSCALHPVARSTLLPPLLLLAVVTPGIFFFKKIINAQIATYFLPGLFYCALPAVLLRTCGLVWVPQALPLAPHVRALDAVQATDALATVTEMRG